LFYTGLAELTHHSAEFVRDGLRCGEPVMVMIGRTKLDALREALGSDADRVRLVDMEGIGRNPARIIPAWAAFFSEHGGATTPPRGIGEPIWRARTPAELIEAQLHESLINLAFAGAQGRLLCPYDLESLDPGVIAEAHRGHPLVFESSSVRDNHESDERPWLDPRFSEPLPVPPAFERQLTFDRASLHSVRDAVSGSATRHGLPAHRVDDAALAAHELAANSIRYGGGEGVLAVWIESDTLVCEIRDRGHIADPLAGRHLPSLDRDGGRGLWLVHQLSDLTQIRSAPGHTVVRVRVGS
jgi:anti-sigma regulatory factor (Ser/Thr protein kinase)